LLVFRLEEDKGPERSAEEPVVFSFFAPEDDAVLMEKAVDEDHAMDEEEGYLCAARGCLVREIDELERGIITSKQNTTHTFYFS